MRVAAAIKAAWSVELGSGRLAEFDFDFSRASIDVRRLAGVFNSVILEGEDFGGEHLLVW